MVVYDENDRITYMSNNNSINKAKIVKINNHGYAVIKPLKNKFVKLNTILESFSHIELREHILQNIINKIDGIKIKT